MRCRSEVGFDYSRSFSKYLEFHHIERRLRLILVAIYLTKPSNESHVCMIVASTVAAIALQL